MRREEDAALLVMTRDHVGRVLGEQPVALLADANRVFRPAMNELHADGQARGVDGGAHGAEQASRLADSGELGAWRHEAERPASGKHDRDQVPATPAAQATTRRSVASAASSGTATIQGMRKEVSRR